ncbi:MAG: CDP-diacylglycerol--glycerol-3-phosphate 3-phosphatidyltransferase [Pseudomonadota bacterium]
MIAQDKARERALTLSVPNLLTYGRILAVPALVACFFLAKPLGYWLAFVLFVAASITDYLDGHLARAWSQQSALGRMLDPIADKLLIAACLLSLCAFQIIESWSLWAAVIILFREIAVSGLREFLAGLQVSMPVSHLAKWKTAIQMVALAVLLVGPAIGEPLVTIGLALLWIAAAVTLITGYDYFRAGIRHLLEDDR